MCVCVCVCVCVCFANSMVHCYNGKIDQVLHGLCEKSWMFYLTGSSTHICSIDLTKFANGCFLIVSTHKYQI